MSTEVSKYLIAGAVAFGCDITFLYFCTDVLGLHYLVSNAIGYLVGVIVAYLLNVNWVFADRVYVNRQLEFLLFNVIVFAGLLLSELLMLLFVEVAGIGYLLAKVYSSAFVMVFNFVGKKVVLFHAPELAPVAHASGPRACCNCGFESPAYQGTGQSFDSAPGAQVESFNLVRCARCGLVSTSMDSIRELADYYPESYYGGGTAKFLGIIEQLLQFGARLRARRILRVWNRAAAIRRSPRVLDVGCGRAILLRSLQAYGADVLGLERAEFPLDHSSRDIVEVKTLAELAGEGREFDVGILWHVLEHLESPDATLDGLSRCLSDTGVLVLVVPNYASFQRRLFGPYWFHLDLPRHLVHIESDWLVQRLRDRGFELVRQSHFDLVQNVYGFIQSAMNVCFPSRPNAYYVALKQSTGLGRERVFALLSWSALALFLFPFACIELLVSSLFNRGATVQLYAQRSKTL